MSSMDNIGDTLKTARESYNKSLVDLSKLTNLSVKQLTLLEENKFDEIGEGVFVIGFLRIYAKVLRINPNLIIDAYKRNYENISLLPSGEDEDSSDNHEIKNVTFLKKTFITIFSIVTAFIFIFLIEKGKIESNNSNSNDEIEQIGDNQTSNQINQTNISRSNEANKSTNYDSLKNDESTNITFRLVFSQECWIEIKDINGNIVNSSVNPANSELSFESNLPLFFIFGNAEGVALYISGSIFDHKPFTKVSVARFSIPN